MSCPNCTISERQIAFKLSQKIKELITEHFSHHMYAYSWEDTILHTSETAGNDLVDFLQEMSLSEGVTFRIPHHDWLPLNEYQEFKEASWVDKIIREKYIRMYFQPIVTQEGSIYGYELLARFINPEGETVFPNVLFPAAKLRGRTFALDRLCRTSAVKQVKRLSADQKAFINFIPTAIYQPEYCLRTTTATANKLGIDSSRFVFEVVETEKVADIDHLKSILRYYQKNGFNYALDDVGAGYNTLDMLGELEPPYVKLDMAYAQGVSQSQEKQAVALSFLKKAQSYGAKCLAEGIESIDDFNWLKSQGYELFQGYLFGRPQPDPLTETKIDLSHYGY